MNRSRLVLSPTRGRRCCRPSCLPLEEGPAGCVAQSARLRFVEASLTLARNPTTIMKRPSCRLQALGLLGFTLLLAPSPGRRRRQGRLQPRYPADPVGQLLRVPRPRREDTRKAKLRLDTHGRRLRRAAKRRHADRAGQERREPDHRPRITAADADERMPPPDSGKKLTAAADRAAEAVDRPGGRVPGPLGVRRARRGRRCRRSRTQAWAAQRRSTASSWRGWRRKGLQPSPAGRQGHAASAA